MQGRGWGDRKGQSERQDQGAEMERDSREEPTQTGKSEALIPLLAA